VKNEISLAGTAVN